MSATDEARAARIQKYKEERRKQLTAKTAALFSTNVTERRPKRADRPPSVEIAEDLKSSSELNLTTTSTSVPIRTTRASRLRAAAAHSDTSPSTRKSTRSSSVQSLLDDSKTKTKSKIIDRDKKINRQISHEKENAKSATTYDIGANKTKFKHSISKNILDKSNNIVTSPKSKYDEKQKKDSIYKDKKANEDIHIHVNGVEIFDDIVGDNSVEKEQIDDLFNDLVVNGVELKIDDDESTRLINSDANTAKADCVKLEDSVVPKEDVGSLLGAVCVRKVERFSELLSNLCSPCEADLLFEDILVENGINGESSSRTAPECTPPCRRAQPAPRPVTAPKHAPAQTNAVAANDAAGMYRMNT